MAKIELPPLGIGTWGMGGTYTRDESNVDESIELLRYGFDRGMTLVDVAELYGEGLAEEILGRAMDGRKRSDILVISKVWKTHLRHDEVLRAAEGSLKRLKTDYIDLYLVHWPSDEGVPLKETMEAMEGLVACGMVKNIGVSNFSAPLMQEAMSYLKNVSLAANEIEYSLTARDAEKDVIPFCKENDIAVIAYRPLARGLLTRADGAVATVAKKYGKTPAQVALNWIISQDISAIPKPSTKAQIDENAGALGWKMSAEDIKSLGSGKM